MMSILALKMQHQESYDADYLQNIGDTELIYEEVKALKVPFHKWYKWLEKTFMLMKDDFDRQN